PERRISASLLGQKIEEIPLRHESDEPAMGRQMPEIRERHLGVAEPRLQLGNLLVRKLQKSLEQAELVHELEGRGVEGVAAVIAEEVGVFFQHDDVGSGPREQEAQHHPGGAANYATLHGNLF